MTPGARVAAAISVLTEVQNGDPAEKALTRWARRSRFAGSKDRAAVRDHVYDVLRKKTLAAHFGKGSDARALVIGALRVSGTDLDTVFSGEGHAPEQLSASERSVPNAPTDPVTRWSLPAWIVPHLEASLGDDAEDTALALQERAPITVRVNAAKTTVAQAQQELASEGVETVANPLSTHALTATKGGRKLRNTKAFLNGHVELQDASSQAVADTVPRSNRVLDYCAGGGGKALALAAHGSGRVFAHDIDPARMSDLPSRALRAGVEVSEVLTKDLMGQDPFDAVLCDASCSGSGAWRRNPEGKWRLTPERLGELTALQDEILDRAADLLTGTGTLVFATCSIFRVENEDRVAAFLARHAGWGLTFSKRFAVSQDGDGFFVAHLKRVR